MPLTAGKCGKLRIFVANSDHYFATCGEIGMFSTLYGPFEALMQKWGFCIDYFFTTFVLSCYDFNHKRFK